MKFTKEQILDKINTLEIKADHYSRTDWDRYNEVRDELHNLDKILLDMYCNENINFLETNKDIA